MADLSNGSSVFQTYNNAGTGVTELGDNKKAESGQGIAGRTRIINLAKTNMTQAELDAALLFITQGGTAGTDDAHTVVGVQPLTESGVFTSGTTDAVQVAIQGTGVCTVGANYGVGTTGVTSSLLAEFSGISG
jgi:hypothetical protein